MVGYDNALKGLIGGVDVLYVLIIALSVLNDILSSVHHATV